MTLAHVSVLRLVSQGVQPDGHDAEFEKLEELTFVWWSKRGGYRITAAGKAALLFFELGREVGR